MGFVTKVIVFNSGIFKKDKNEHKFERIYLVGTTYGISGYFEGSQCQSGAMQMSV